MGAGDVKLLMLVGAWLGYAECGEAAIAAILLGGIFAIFDTLSRGRLFTVFYSIFRFFSRNRRAWLRSGALED